MSRWWGRAVLLALVTPLLLIGQDARAQEIGEIEGVVTNGTTNGFVEGVTVTLTVFRDTVPVESLEAVADAEGRFGFDSLDPSPGMSYVVSTNYRGVDYTTQPASLTGPSAPFHLVVYETTTVDDDISILSASMAIPSVDATTGLIQVLEVITFVNRGDRTYVGQLFTDPENGGVLRLHLPPGSLDIELGQGFGDDDPLPAPDGMLGRSPVPPGDFNTVYAYKLPFVDEASAIVKFYAYTVEKATFLISTSGPRPSSMVLTDVQTVNINGDQNFSLSGRNIQAGEPLAVVLSGLPQLLPPGAGDGGVSLETVLRSVGIAAIAALFAGVTLYTVRGRNRRLVPVGSELRQLHALEEERLALIASMADLDDQFEAGRLAHESYQSTRRRRRQRLVDVMLLIKGSAEER